jgi:hypothetical protein
MQRDGSGKWVIYNAPRSNPIGRPDWSHDGKLVVFNSYDSITVVEVATAKSCVLTGSMAGMASVQGAPKFHPGYPNPLGEGTYVVAWTDYAYDRVSKTVANDIFSTAFRFQEGTCLLTQPIRNLTGTPGYEEKGVAWSPLGDHIATIVTGGPTYEHRLSVHDTTELEYGAVLFNDHVVEHSLAKGYLAMYWWDETTLQWVPNGNRVAVVGTWMPDGVTMAGEIIAYNVVTNVWGTLTNTPEVEGYFDFMPDGVGMVVQRENGVYLDPGDSMLATVEMRSGRVVKTPTHPAWNPTRP